MKGINTLTLNHDTLCEIVEWHLNNRLLAPGGGKARVVALDGKLELQDPGAPALMALEIKFETVEPSLRDLLKPAPGHNPVPMPSPSRAGR